MAATPGSKYQAILVQHIANNPPNAYPQTSQENWTEYYNRMQNQGLPPDIGASETDSDYVTRLATYEVNPPVVQYSAVYAATAGSATTAVYAATAGSATTATSGAGGNATALVPLSAGVTMSFVNGFYSGSVA